MRCRWGNAGIDGADVCVRAENGAYSAVESLPKAIFSVLPHVEIDDIILLFDFICSRRRPSSGTDSLIPS